MAGTLAGELKLYPTGLLKPDVVLNVRDGRRAIVRGAQRLFGASLCFATLGLWMFDAGYGDPAEILSKLMVSIVMLFSGAALWQAGAPVSRPELEIDLVRREIRLVRFGVGRKILVERCKFRELWRAEFRGQTVRIWEKDGGLMAEMAMGNAAALNRLRRVLRIEGVEV